jgi:hypothetical protein
MTEVGGLRCSCGATLVRGALACSLCHAPVAVPVASAATAPIADGAAGVDGPQPIGANGFLAAPPPSTQRNDMREFSRVKAGPTSFGWTGRIVITVLCMIPIVFVWFMTGGGVVSAVLSLPVFLLPLWFLRENWRRSRIR